MNRVATISFRTIGLLFLSLFLTWQTASFAQSAHAKHRLIELNDLQALGQEAQKNQLPIMLLFSAKWCDYCLVLKDQVLEPMLLSGMYEGQWMYMRQVNLDDGTPLKTIDGRTLSKGKWAFQMKADLTPTILFLDGNGKQVAEPIIGISEVTLYTGLIHSRLNQAYQTMGLKRQIPATPELLENAIAK